MKVYGAHPLTRGVYTDDAAEFARSDDREPLGKHPRGMTSEFNVRSVDEVRVSNGREALLSMNNQAYYKQLTFSADSLGPLNKHW